ncbi:MAG: beta-phosphoglucomutase [Oscillospiraceae bacterium]|nr:beta-phosphoglucomutase [Oscillospiraceae bacterium]
MELKAIIFDLDGVICFTDEYHYLAWKAMADSIGVPFDREVNNRLRGVSRMASLDIVLERSTESYSQAEKENLANQKNELYKQYLTRITEQDLSPEVKETLLALREKGLKLAIGSSSKNTPMILQRLGLEGFFDAVSDGNNITHSKPDPEVFIKAAQMLGMPAENCLVVEDAVSGTEAGHRAGMQVACLGDASAAGAGEYNMASFGELLTVAQNWK